MLGVMFLYEMTDSLLFFSFFITDIFASTSKQANKAKWYVVNDFQYLKILSLYFSFFYLAFQSLQSHKHALDLTKFMYLNEY